MVVARREASRALETNAPEAEVEAGANVDEFHPWNARSGFFQLDGVMPQHHPLRLRFALGAGDWRAHDDPIDSLQVDRVHDSAPEGVDHDRLELLVVAVGFELIPGKGEARLGAEDRLGFRDGRVLLDEALDADLEEIVNFLVVDAAEGEVVRPFLRVRPQNEGAAVCLSAQELQARLPAVLEGRDVVVLSRQMRALHLVPQVLELPQNVLNRLARLSAVEKEEVLAVLDLLRRALVEEPPALLRLGLDFRRAGHRRPRLLPSLGLRHLSRSFALPQRPLQSFGRRPALPALRISGSRELGSSAAKRSFREKGQRRG